MKIHYGKKVNPYVEVRNVRVGDIFVFPENGNTKMKRTAMNILDKTGRPRIIDMVSGTEIELAPDMQVLVVDAVLKIGEHEE